MNQFVYSFNEGSKEMRNLLGTKGANLAELMQIGLPVPFGFTITSKACVAFFENGCKLPEEVENEILEKIAELEDVTGKTFGRGENPLLVSVRTGAAVYVPGLAETILNVGMNDETSAALCRLTENREFTEDTYRRFKEMYAKIVGLGEGETLPQDARQQLLCAVQNAFLSWHSEEVTSYIRRHEIDPKEVQGAAVSIQAMVFGNLGDESAVGIATTRSCQTGEKKLTGNFTTKTQGKDAQKKDRLQDISKLAENFPKVYERLLKISEILEQHYKDVQTVAFTVENNKLHIIQTAAAERTPRAALKIATDMVSEGLITRKTAILRQNAEDMPELVSKIREARHGGETATAAELAATEAACAAELEANYKSLMEWADEVRELKIRVNADSETEAAEALELGAEGIGLCRTENMFLHSGKLPVLKEMLMSEDSEKRRELLHSLKTQQRSDFEKLYRAMGEMPVNIRLLDIPVTLPEIIKMQTEAIVEAALRVESETEREIEIELLVPMISTLEEFKRVKNTVTEAAKSCLANSEKKPRILLGVMIETPRAALIADKIAAECDFFSFGTNDLTQMVFGISRNDATSEVIGNYVEKGILKENPFKTLDIDGVGRLMEFAATAGKHTKPRLKLAICGEQASDGRSIDFCHRIGMNYISCLPGRVPAAKLAAAQAAVRNEVREI